VLLRYERSWGPRVGRFGHPNSTRLAAIGVLVCKAVCSRSDPRKAEQPPAARANWFNYRVASHLHQLSYRQHENASAPSAISRGAAVTVAADCVANRGNCSRRPVVGKSLSETCSQRCIANVTIWLPSCNCGVTVRKAPTVNGWPAKNWICYLTVTFLAGPISAKEPTRTGRRPPSSDTPAARVRSPS
jgi:hypothetical protein